MPASFTMSVPPACLSPNARTHYMAKARATKAVRRNAGLIARSIGIAPPLESAAVRLTFRFPDRRKRDRDNLVARCKAIFDGLQDAGVVRDDSDITHLPARIVHAPGEPASVEVEIDKA